MNRATKANATAVGVVFGIGGIAHGLGEALQGNTPTDGLVVNAIAAGSSWTRWSEGGEPAFTLVPNFLVTGILATLVGLAVIVWSAGFLHRRRARLSAAVYPAVSGGRASGKCCSSCPRAVAASTSR